MGWFLRAIELDNGRWACRWGLRELDDHGDHESAVAHLREFAREIGNATIFLHGLDGSVVRLD